MASFWYLWSAACLATFGFSRGTPNNGLLNNAVQDGPEFTDIIENITVPAGRNVKLACSVKNLGPYKVAWMHFEQSAILTVHNHVITRNPRISVTHDKHDKHKTWFLHISNVQEEDKGRYMCQINTVTAKTQFGYLHVVVPPNIDDSASSSDMTVGEGANVTMNCKATGSPEPTLKWKRNDNSKIKLKDDSQVLDVEGEVLELRNVSREEMGGYLCIASNSIPPSVSKLMQLNVEFSPKLSVPHSLVGIPLTFNVTLECNVEAHPTSFNYWTRDNDSSTSLNMIQDSSKHKTEFVNLKPSYKYVMRLTIYDVNTTDCGVYRCVAKNSKGQDDGTIRLYSTPPPTTIPPSTTVTTTRRVTTTTRAPVPMDPTLLGQTPTVRLFDNTKGTKYQSSNLNDIDRYEQKSASASASAAESSKGLDWPQEDNKHNGKHSNANANSGGGTAASGSRGIGLGILIMVSSHRWTV